MIEHEDLQLAQVQGRAPVRVKTAEILHSHLKRGQSNLQLGVVTHRTHIRIVEYIPSGKLT